MSSYKAEKQYSNIHEQLRLLVKVLKNIYSPHSYAVFSVNSVVNWLDFLRQDHFDLYSLIMTKLEEMRGGE